MTKREEVMKQLKQVGMRPESEHWISYILNYRNFGQCGSVNHSTVEFIPVISKLLERIDELESNQ